jgi:hypothetical protein
MQDERLIALMDAAMSEPYPPGCTGEAIHGVELVLLDADIYGVASQYRGSDRAVSVAHRALLIHLVADVDRVWADLPNDAARDFYGKYREMAAYLVESRS